MRRVLHGAGFLFLAVAGFGAAVALAGGDHGKGGHDNTVTVTETVETSGQTQTVVETFIPAQVTVTDVETVTLPVETTVVTDPAVTVVETQVVKSKPRVITKVKWRTKVKWKTRTVIRKVCKPKPPPPRPCCEGSG